jgi:hypothetical protein
MKKITIATALVVALGLGFSAQPAAAGGGNFWGGFGAGAATGLLFGTLAAPAYAPPPAYYYAPAPVYMAPGPVCRDITTGGFWGQVPMTDAGGFVTYRSEWVPATTQRICQ